MLYPEGTVRALLQTDLVTDATRQAVLARLSIHPDTPQFFAPDTYRLLEAVVARLIPQPDRAAPINLAAPIDARLAAGKSDGWRYDTMPPDREAYRLGLGGINQAAETLMQQPFVQLDGAQQDAVLEVLAAGRAPGANWEQVPQDRFWEELLAEVTENYYAHPLAQEEIGYVGLADVPGWHRIGLNELEPREPEPLA